MPNEIRSHEMSRRPAPVHSPVLTGLGHMSGRAPVQWPILHLRLSVFRSTQERSVNSGTAAMEAADGPTGHTSLLLAKTSSAKTN